MNKDYVLDFTIPQGPTGPTGPIGPSDGFIRAFGYLYNQEEIDSIFLPNNQQIQIAFPLRPLKLNIFYPSNNTIGFLSSGAYIISYSILLQVPDASSENIITITTNLRLNDTVSDASSTVRVIKDNSLHYFTNTVIANRNVNDVVDLLIFADKQLDFNYKSAFLYAIKISELAQP